MSLILFLEPLLSGELLSLFDVDASNSFDSILTRNWIRIKSFTIILLLFMSENAFNKINFVTRFSEEILNCNVILLFEFMSYEAIMQIYLIRNIRSHLFR